MVKLILLACPLISFVTEDSTKMFSLKDISSMQLNSGCVANYAPYGGACDREVSIKYTLKGASEHSIRYFYGYLSQTSKEMAAAGKKAKSDFVKIQKRTERCLK